MEVMVTGSKGFLGRNLIKQLLNSPEIKKVYAVNRQSGYSIESSIKKEDRLVDIYADLSNPGYTASLFQEIKPSIIFHLAAQQGRTAEAFNANVSMTSNLLKDCPDNIKFVYASSSTVYGDLAVELENEAKIVDNIRPEQYWQRCCHEKHQTIPTSLYGSSKLAGEALVNAYHSSGKIRGLILRYVAMVGRDASHGVLPDIIRKVKADGPLKLFGDYPGSIKPYMHINDVVNATLHLTNNDCTGIYNIAPNEEMSIASIATNVMFKMNRPRDIEWLGNSVLPPGDNKLVKLDNRKLYDTGWIPTFLFSREAIINATREIIS